MADSITVSPTLLTFDKVGGSYDVTFSNMPSGGLSWNITYNYDTDWITEVAFNNNVATVTVEENAGIKRSAVIRFSHPDNSDYIDYVINNDKSIIKKVETKRWQRLDRRDEHVRWDSTGDNLC